MTGPEHYLEAEKLLEAAGEYSAHDGDAVALVQRAGVHAELARAAGLGALLANRHVDLYGVRTPLADHENVRAWADAIGIEPL